MHKLKQAPKINHLLGRRDKKEHPNIGIQTKTPNLKQKQNPVVEESASYSKILGQRVQPQKKKSDENGVLQQILEKLQAQEVFYSELNVRLTKLEKSVKKFNHNG